MAENRNDQLKRPEVIQEIKKQLEELDIKIQELQIQRQRLMDWSAGYLVADPIQLYAKARFEQQMERAKKLLLEGLPVGRISRMVGWRNPNSISNIFLEKFGMSPTHWRDSHRNKIC